MEKLEELVLLGNTELVFDQSGMRVRAWSVQSFAEKLIDDFFYKYSGLKKDSGPPEQ